MSKISRLLYGFDAEELRKPINHSLRKDPEILDQFLCGDKVEKTSVYLYPDRVEIHRHRQYRESQGGEDDTFRFEDLVSVSSTKYIDTKIIRFNFKPYTTYYFSHDIISQPRNDNHYIFPNEVVCGNEEKQGQHLFAIQRAISDYKNKPRFTTFINNGTYVNITNQLYQIQQEINEKGGADSEELLQLLNEVRDLIKRMETTKKIDKNSSTWDKIMDCADQHGWAFGAILSTIGQAILMLGIK